MKIVQYISRIRLEDGGVVRAVLDLCGALAASGHDVTLMTFDSPDVPGQWRDGSAGFPQVRNLRCGIGRLPCLSGKATARAGEWIGQADVLHLHGPWDPAGLQLSRIARRAGVPYVVSLHGMLDDWCVARKALKKRLYLRAVGQRFLEQAACVHCTAQAEQDQSRKWYPRGRSHIVPLIFDLTPFERLPGPQLARETYPQAFSGEPVVLFVGLMKPLKRVELLIESAAILREDGHEMKVLIAGAGDQRYEGRLRRLAQQLRLEDRVEFLGFVGGSEKLSLYQAADVFVLPSRHENWGFVIVEALLCQTPVITTRGVAIWQELEEGGGAVVVQDTPRALAAAIVTLVSDQTRRQDMGQAGRDWVRRSLDVDELVGQYISLYGRAAR
jgi:glycosyltransferase involved in cell wall biosynthesis